MKKILITFSLLLFATLAFSQSWPRMYWIQVQQSDSTGSFAISNSTNDGEWNEVVRLLNGPYVIVGSDTIATRDYVRTLAVMDSTRLAQDSILVYYQGGSEVGRDTIAGTGGGTGDNWGSQVVVSDATLSGTGVTGSELKVDTAEIATQYDITQVFRFTQFSDQLGFGVTIADDPDDIIKMFSSDGDIQVGMYNDDATYGDYIDFNLANSSVTFGKLSSAVEDSILTKLTFVTSDGTLSGNGRALNELKVDTSVIATVSALQDTAAAIRGDFPTPDGNGIFDASNDGGTLGSTEFNVTISDSLIFSRTSNPGASDPAIILNDDQSDGTISGIGLQVRADPDGTRSSVSYRPISYFLGSSIRWQVSQTDETNMEMLFNNVDTRIRTTWDKDLTLQADDDLLLTSTQNDSIQLETGGSEILLTPSLLKIDAPLAYDVSADSVLTRNNSTGVIGLTAVADLGGGSSNAEDIVLADTASFYDATNVEQAIREVRDLIRTEATPRKAMQFWKKVIDSKTGVARYVVVTFGDSVGSDKWRMYGPKIHQTIGGEYDELPVENGLYDFAGNIEVGFEAGTTALVDSFALWPNGEAYKLVSETKGLELGGSTNMVFDKLQIFAIQRSGAGSFTVTTDEGTTSAYNLNGTDSLRMIEISHDLSGTTVDINATGEVVITHMQKLNTTASSVVEYSVGKGGISLESANNSETFFVDFLEHITPDLFQFEFKDPPSQNFDTEIGALYDYAIPVLDSCDILAIGTSPGSNTGERNYYDHLMMNNRHLRDSTLQYSQGIFYDGFSVFTNAARLEAFAIEGDGTHLSADANAIAAADILREVFQIQTTFGGSNFVNDEVTASKLAHNTTIDKNFIFGNVNPATTYQDYFMETPRSFQIKDSTGFQFLVGTDGSTALGATYGLVIRNDGSTQFGTNSGLGVHKFGADLSVTKNSANAQIVVERSGTNDARATLIAATNSGNFIVENAPVFAIDVNGRSNLLRIYHPDEWWGGIGIGYTGSGNPQAILDLQFDTDTNGKAHDNAFRVRDRTGGGSTDILTLAKTGELGIGDDTPDALLDVAGTMRLDSTFFDKDGDAGTSGQVLSSTGTETNWVSLPSAGATIDSVHISGDTVIVTEGGTDYKRALKLHRVLDITPSTSTTISIDLDNYRGTICQVDMTTASTASTITLTVTNPEAAGVYTFHFQNTGSTNSLDLPATFKDQAGAALDGGTTYDIDAADEFFTCYYDGTNYYCK